MSVDGKWYAGKQLHYFIINSILRLKVLFYILHEYLMVTWHADKQIKYIYSYFSKVFYCIFFLYIYL